MTQRDVERGREIVERWCGLAEQRLAHLAELFETGRWRRYHTEAAFLENIREAKAAVETWRMLASREATPDNRPLDLSWLGRGRGAYAGSKQPVAPLPVIPTVLSFAALAPQPKRAEMSAQQAAVESQQNAAEVKIAPALLPDVFEIARAAMAFPKPPLPAGASAAVSQVIEVAIDRDGGMLQPEEPLGASSAPLEVADITKTMLPDAVKTGAPSANLRAPIDLVGMQQRYPHLHNAL